MPGLNYNKFLTNFTANLSHLCRIVHGTEYLHILNLTRKPVCSSKNGDTTIIVLNKNTEVGSYYNLFKDRELDLQALGSSRHSFHYHISSQELSFNQTSWALAKACVHIFIFNPENDTII